MTISEILRKAADVLRERGHCKGTYEDDAGHVCAIGAIRVAKFGNSITTGGVEYYGALEFFEEYLSEEFGAISVPEFNDASVRTPETVIAVLNSAARMAEVRER